MWLWCMQEGLRRAWNVECGYGAKGGVQIGEQGSGTVVMVHARGGTGRAGNVDCSYGSKGGVQREEQGSGNVVMVH